MMDLRTVVGGLGGAVALAFGLLAAPLVVEGQPAGNVPRIGVLFASTPAVTPQNIEALRRGLGALGHVEGRTFVMEIRYAQARAERFPELVRELLSLKVDVILASTDGAVAAVRQQTQAIPIVMINSIDPVGTGFVASLARPGGNVTGFSNVSSELSGKRLELLREAVPELSRVACFWNPDVRGAVLDYKETEGAARSLRLQLQSVEVPRVEDLERAFSAVTSQRAQAIVVLAPNPVLFANRDQLVGLAQRNRLPAMYAQSEFVKAGGLMSYGPSVPDLWRRAATYADKILKGAKPGDLPVEQPTKFELVVNLNTAKALGLTIPPSVLSRADEIIR